MNKFNLNQEVYLIEKIGSELIRNELCNHCGKNISRYIYNYNIDKIKIFSISTQDALPNGFAEEGIYYNLKDTNDRVTIITERNLFLTLEEAQEEFKKRKTEYLEENTKLRGMVEQVLRFK